MVYRKPHSGWLVGGLGPGGLEGLPNMKGGGVALESRTTNLPFVGP